MQNRPIIKTAIPKGRYQIGDFSASLLGEVESGDDRDYRYILAFVPMGKREPSFYVCAERVRPAESAQGGYRLRIINEAMSEVMDTADQWGDKEHFSEQGIALACQALGLQQEQVIKLL